MGCQAPSTVTETTNNSRVTNLTYDLFCRETEQTVVGGAFAKTRYVNFGDPTSQYVETAAPHTSNTEILSRSYFDGFGETRKTERTGKSTAANELIVTRADYDQRGNLFQSSRPYRAWKETSSDIGQLDHTSVTYDALDRPLVTTLADGAQQSVSYATYDALPVTVFQDPHCFDNDSATLCTPVRVYKDARGNVVKKGREDTLGSDVGSAAGWRFTEYDYDLLNNLTGVSVRWHSNVYLHT